MPTPLLQLEGAGPLAPDTLLPSLNASGGTLLSIALALLVVALCGGGVLLYLARLQQRFLAMCREHGEVSLFASTPAGVPEGTIRATLALFLAFTGIAFLALSSLPGLERVPEFLTGVLGTVLGFYFGARASGGPGVSTRREADVPTAGKPAQADERLDQAEARLEAGLAIAKAVGRALPNGRGNKITRVAGALDEGLMRLRQLRADGAESSAHTLASGLLQRLQREHPIGGLLARAMTSLASVLGGALPPLALATTVVTIGAKLGGRAYERWAARILHTPYATDLITPSKFDANSAIAMLRRAPLFRQAFAPEVERGDRAFLLDLLHQALAEDARSTLWTRFGAPAPGGNRRFEDQALFEAGLAEFRRAALEAELKRDLPHFPQSDALDLDVVLDAVDRLHADPAAQADLDALVLVTDELRREGLSPDVLVREAAASLATGKADPGGLEPSS